MDGTTVSTLTEALVNVLLGSFTIVCISLAVNMIQSIINDRRREKRELESAARDLEYHEARMKDLNRK